MLNKAFFAPLLATLVLIAAAPSVHSDEMAQATTDLCETVKSCALKQMGASDMTPEMKQMMGPMLDGMCQGITASVVNVPKNHELYKPAVACMQSMNKLGCALVEDGGNSGDTVECKDYAKKAEKYGDMQQ